MGCGASKRYSLVALESPLAPVSWICRGSIDLQENNFKSEKVLGKGKFGIVSLSLCNETKTYVAIKYIPKDIIFESKAASRIKQEIEFVRILNHPFIISFMGEFTTPACICLVFQYAPGGEFFTRLKRQMKLPDSHAMFYFGEIALALKYLHDLHIVYRDLKPENILLDEHGHVKVCDFGFAASVGKGDEDNLKDFCGTAMYISPEIAAGQKQSHGAAVDWWALGVVLCEMLTGSAPFGDSDNMSKFEIFNNINTRSPSFPISMSSGARALATGLLIKEPGKRFGWKQVQESQWLEQMDWTALLKKRIPAPWVPRTGKAGDSSNFVDWSKITVPTAEPSEAVSKYCQGIAYNTGRRRASVQSAQVAVDGSHSAIPASQRKTMTRRGSTGSFDHKAALAAIDAQAAGKVKPEPAPSGNGRRSSVSPGDDTTASSKAALKKGKTSSELRKR